MNMTIIAGRNSQNHCPKLANSIAISGSHETSTSLTNKFIPSKLLDKETELFRNIVNQVKLLIEKGFLTSSTY